MFPVKKKPAIGISIGLKPKEDPEAPDSLEAPKPSPFGAKPKAKPAAPPMDDTGADEGAESPGYESSEQTGATLIKDIESAGTNLGLDAAQSRSFAADVFSSMADCLRRGQSGGAADTSQEESGEYPA